MADFFINVFLDDEKLKKIESAELADQVIEIDGKKALQVGMTKKDKKKLIKGFEELTFDDSNACVLPEDGENTLLGIITDMKSVDVMKFAITKLYNPLAGRDVFGRGSGGR
ncbi:MAG: hypothetical protein JRF47_12520 [Deltaproteobacteria bacterium]|nr:hypothetical protein [Deltaproteobacteria bacterium]